MKINPKIFSLPPYISTSWNHVVALYCKEGNLVVTLGDGDLIEIPDLKPDLIDTIFSAHAAHLEHEIAKEHFTRNSQNPNKIPNGAAFPPILSGEASGDSPFRFAFSTLDGLGYALQHNPSQATAPDIPKEVLQKISSIAKIVAPEETDSLPPPEPHCNCMYCQIAKAIHKEVLPQPITSTSEEAISDEELKFQEWEIIQTGDKMFSVSNKLDSIKKFNVYLGDPVGCTCGEAGCEHILAVLKS